MLPKTRLFLHQQTPAEIDSAVRGLKAQFDAAGVAWPLQRVADRVYKLGAKKVTLKMMAGRLMGEARNRSGEPQKCS
jgi:hypothetical protein